MPQVMLYILDKNVELRYQNSFVIKILSAIGRFYLDSL